MMILANWSEYLSKTWNHPAFVPTSITVLCLLLLLLLLRSINKRHRPFVVHSADGGEIRISRSALHDLVSNASRDALPTRKPKVSFKTRRGRLSIDLKVRIPAGKKLEKVYQDLKAGLTRTLEETLGSEHIGEIKLIIAGFEPTPSRSVSTMHSHVPAETETPVDSTEEDATFSDSQTSQTGDKSGSA